MKTLNDLITTAILSGASIDAPEPSAQAGDAEVATEDVEKIASVLEFLGKRGIGKLLAIEKSAMSAETNADKDPGDGKEVDLSSTGVGSHHKGLSSNEAAIAVNPKEKVKAVAPALSKVLKARAFADPCLQKNLRHTDTDKNSKTKSAHDLQAVRAELVARATKRGSNA